MTRFALGLALAFTTLFASVAAAPPTPATQLPVVGSVAGGGTFTGTLNFTKFATSNGVLIAVGTLTGSLTNAAGQTVTLLQTLALPVANVTATCEILHLDIGPISLDLLGLNVNLSRVVLDISAQPGAGNLLGNLLCSVANLLNNPSGLANLLNQILSLL